jgi:hypothetical protein
LTIAVALSIALAGGGAGAVSAQKPAPQLRVTKIDPLEVRGSHFRVRERVRVTVVYGELQRARVVRASRIGSFTTAFPTVSVEKCGGSITVRAVGARGSRAATQLTPPSICPPPPP